MKPILADHHAVGLVAASLSGIIPDEIMGTLTKLVVAVSIGFLSGLAYRFGQSLSMRVKSRSKRKKS